MPGRLEQLQRWLTRDVGIPRFDITPASSDASFRRYFRVRWDGQTRIVMDAPPAHEDCRSYIAIARALHGAGLNVPQVLEADLEQGFLLLTDLGSVQYLDVLNDASVERLYGDALDALLALQTRPDVARQAHLPPYDEALLMREMHLFRDWLLTRHLHITLDDAQLQSLEHTFAHLAQSALEQPRVPVHRDYHSRNLMLTQHNNPGILDFQDAVVGPITYDLVSLLRDCYIAWPEPRVHGWMEQYRQCALASGLLAQDDAAQFTRWFDWMGVQRHLKAAGIFARLNIRDGKPDYLKDIPRTLNYIVAASARYEELQWLHDLLRHRVLPKLQGMAA
ncbi:MAG: aminoglycoside phosphotransferase [Gammaproteobacteria bacterium]|nr:MAG: aminoglycoside phosphotransferase [Gammaproteobacteria bacterium]